MGALWSRVLRTAAASLLLVGAATGQAAPEPAEPAAVPIEPEDPSPQASAGDVVVDLTAGAQAAPAMAAQTVEEAPWSEGGEVIHGAFATEEDAPLDLVDPDGGPPTEAYLNLFNEGTGDSGDRFLDELRRAVDDEPRPAV